MMRRFYIWIFSLAVILLIYLVINALSSREPMSIEKTSSEITADTNSSPTGGQVSRLGDVAITELKKTVYMHRNQKGEVDREFGFREVIRSEGSFWEIDRPFINFFRRDFTCYLSSDKGNIETETVSGQPSPKAGSMKENVIIHIVPKQGAEIKESFIYLDDISFESDRSQASTSGPVRFVSEDVELKGNGLVFVFNGGKERLEFLRIPQLEFLKIRTSSKVLMFGSEKENFFSGDNLASDVVISDEKAAPADRTNVQQILTEEADRLYRWVFNKNVVIDSPEQLVLADQFFVNNIFLKATGRQSSSSDIPPQEEFVPPWAKQVEHLGLYKVRGSAGMASELVDITIRCDGGILVTPMDTNIKPQDVMPDETVTGGKGLAGYGDPKGRATLEAARIDYCTLENTAQLTGDCRGTMLEPAGDFQRRYSIWAPKIKAQLSSRRDSSSLVPGLEHLRANGGPVRLAVEKLQQGKLLGFSKILCRQFDFEPKEQLCVAAGPGKIEVDNSTLTEKEAENLSDKQIDKFSLQRPCYAYVENFDTLDYHLDIDRIIADAADKRISIRYLPVVNGQTGQLVKADVGRVEIQLEKGKTGANELSKLRASKGVTYWEEGKRSSSGSKKNLQLDGSELLYNKADSLLIVRPDGSQGCFLNGVKVEGIKYNLMTGRLEQTRILGPGVLW